MKKINSLISLLIAIFVFVSSLFAVFVLNSYEAYADSNVPAEPEYNVGSEEDNLQYNLENEKVACQATIEDEFYDDRIIVVLNQSVSKFFDLSISTIKSMLSSIEFESIENLFSISNPTNELKKHFEEVGYNRIIKINLHRKSKQNVLKLIKFLEKLDFVESAGPDYINTIEPIYSENNNLIDEDTSSLMNVATNDPKLGSQWYLSDNNGINAIEAWKITTGNKNIRVGIIDSGIAKHYDLQDNLVAGYDFYNKNDITDDDEFEHGTHVAGIIGATANNGKGIAGIVPNVTLVPLQVTYNVNGVSKVDSSATIQAISYATESWKANSQIPKISILNYSARDFGIDMSVLNAVKNFPGLFVWAAGNSAIEVNQFPIISQFNLPNLISVGSIDEDGDKSSFSNYGTYVNIFAPGNKILSTVSTDKIENYSGTSMSTPVVAGVAALVWAYKPDLTAAEVKNAIIKGGVPTVLKTPSYEQSAIRLSALGALVATEQNNETVLPLRFKSVQSSSTSYKWDVDIENPNNYDVVVTYNECMCFEGDGREFKNLTHLRTFKLSANGNRTVQINGNGTAGWITACIEYSISNGQVVRLISYTNGLSSKGSLNTPKYNVNLGTATSKNIDLVPNYLNLKVISKSGGTWTIRLENTNSCEISVTYNSKMCFQNDAKLFKNLKDLVDVTISANSYKTITIKENGTAGWIVAAINFKVDGILYRRISYGNGLKSNGTMNDKLTNEIVVSTVFPEVAYLPSYLKLLPTARSGFIIYNWDIKISNNNSFAVQVTYNSKMCFGDDAKNFINLNDLVTITIPANGSKTVRINGNGTAGWITACINCSYNGFEYRKVTCANGIKKSSTNAPTYNVIRFS